VGGRWGRLSKDGFAATRATGRPKTNVSPLRGPELALTVGSGLREKPTVGTPLRLTTG
jgi:hypothetical protein